MQGARRPDARNNDGARPREMAHRSLACPLLRSAHMLRVLLLSSALVATVAAARTAGADVIPEDTVRLKSGDLYRGVLVERVVGDHVTLRLATGALMTFRWGDLAPTETSIVYVKIDADDPRTTLSQRAGTGLTSDEAAPFASRRFRYGTIWDEVCATPCEQRVDATRTYRIDGEGVWPSGPFRLPPGGEELHVKTGSRGALVGGMVLTLVGGSMVLMGSLFAGIGAALPADAGSPEAQKQRDAKGVFLTVGVVQLAIGLVSVAVGIPLWASNTTTVTDDRGNTIGLGPRSKQSWTLTPAGLVF
jgi:hypothetical protein